MKGARDIFAFLADATRRGERGALVTLTDVTGSSSRAPGTHMAVTETGAWRGSFSGGCVEAAVIGEAKRIIADGRAECVRFGAGSRYIDIRLPCGGGVDLLFSPNPDAAALEVATRELDSRQSFALRLGSDGTIAPIDDAPAGWDGDAYIVRHDPDLRLLIVGHGAETLALTRQALSYGARVDLLSPDAAIVAEARATGADVWQLTSPARSPRLVADPHSAIIFLFHDHDWEGELLAQALESDAFFIGAMGSRRTHAARLTDLARRGVPAADITRLVGPVGLIPATRDPDTLALSVLSQVVARHGDWAAMRDDCHAPPRRMAIGEFSS